MVPSAENAHWLAGAVVLLVGLVLLSEAIVGTETFRRRRWRAYFFPAAALASSIFLWIIVVFSTFSTLHLLAHAVWAQAAMIAGGVQLALARGKLRSEAWSLVTAAAIFLSGASFVVHEQNGWLYSRAAFLHHLVGWILIVSTLFPIGMALRPRRAVWGAGFAVTFVLVAVLLFADRSSAPIFGHFGETGAP